MRVEGSVSTATARNNQRAKEGGGERRKRESERSRCSQTVLVLWASPSPTLLTNVKRAVTYYKPQQNANMVEEVFLKV